jgi:hypothetical protein
MRTARGASADALEKPADVLRLSERRTSSLFTNHFGIEIEFTGITRNKAARIAASFLHGTITANHDHYDSYSVRASDNRVWKFMSDASILCQKKQGRGTVSATGKYSVEMVSPVLTYYQDIGILQGLVRCLRKAGGFANSSCGIHIHLDGSNHTPRSIRNFVNIIASKNDLLYKALQIEPARMRYCKKMDAYLVEQMNQQKPTDFSRIEHIWYQHLDGNAAWRYGSRENVHRHIGNGGTDHE